MDIKELILKNPELIEWDSESLGMLYIYWFSLAVQSAIADKYENPHDVNADEFVRYLSTLICSRKNDSESNDRISINDSKQLNESDLNTFAQIFIENNGDIFKESGGDSKIHELRTGLSNHIDESLKKMRKISVRFKLGTTFSDREKKNLLRGAASVSDQLRTIVTDYKAIDSASFALRNLKLPDYTMRIGDLASVNKSIAEIANRTSIANSTISNIYAEHSSLRKSIESISAAHSTSRLFASLDTTRLLQTSLSSQVRLLELGRNTLGSRIGATTALTNDIAAKLSNLTGSYRSVIDSLAEFPRDNVPFISIYTPKEYACELDVIQGISVPADEEYEAEPLSPIAYELESYDDRLCALLEGARQSLNSENPEKARHVTTSVRELFTHVLHGLAPDGEVQIWTSDDSHYHNGRPTRRARLLYICRVFSCDPLTEFVQDDVRAALSLIDSLHEGTHAIQSKLTQRQLEAIVLRMESLVLFLLKVSRGGD
jgi:hypothetical protein